MLALLLTVFMNALLTQAVVAIMSQHKAVVASTAIISWDVETLMDAASIEVIITFINV